MEAENLFKIFEALFYQGKLEISFLFISLHILLTSAVGLLLVVTIPLRVRKGTALRVHPRCASAHNCLELTFGR